MHLVHKCAGVGGGVAVTNLGQMCGITDPAHPLRLLSCHLFSKGQAQGLRPPSPPSLALRSLRWPPACGGSLLQIKRLSGARGWGRRGQVTPRLAPPRGIALGKAVSVGQAPHPVVSTQRRRLPILQSATFFGMTKKPAGVAGSFLTQRRAVVVVRNTGLFLRPNRGLPQAPLQGS